MDNQNWKYERKQKNKEKRYEKAKEYIGNKYERLTIIDIDYEKTEYQYSLNHYYGVFVICQCECGMYKSLPLRVIKKHKIKSCGCLSSETTANNNKQNKSKNNKYDISGEYGIGWTNNTNEEFYFDLEDYDKIKNVCWCSVTDNNGYKYLQGRYNGKLIKIHKLISNYDLVDHNNRNTFDNRKNNLREATKTENNQNHKLRKDNTSGISGVNWHKGKQKWIVRINTSANQREQLGEYPNFEDAVKARLIAEKEYYGEFAPQKHLFEQYGIS